jgi:hypothetical protein
MYVPLGVPTLPYIQQSVSYLKSRCLPWYVVIKQYYIRLIAHVHSHIDNMKNVDVVVLKLSVKHNVIK